MLSRPCPESIAGMARSYKGGVARSVEAPWGAMLSRPCSKSIAGMARSYRGCGGVCRSALGRDALPSVFEEHRGHGPLLQGGVARSVGAPWGAMLFRPCPESIAGMARSYRVVRRAL